MYIYRYKCVCIQPVRDQNTAHRSSHPPPLPTPHDTTRQDMIDEAIMRPGRLEVHVEIGLPDEVNKQGRKRREGGVFVCMSVC